MKITVPRWFVYVVLWHAAMNHAEPLESCCPIGSGKVKVVFPSCSTLILSIMLSEVLFPLQSTPFLHGLFLAISLYFLVVDLAIKNGSINIKMSTTNNNFS